MSFLQQRPFDPIALEEFLRSGYVTNKAPDQVKWPTQMPFYRGADTEKIIFVQGKEFNPKEQLTVGKKDYPKAEQGWDLVPWLGLDDFHKDKSIFSLNTSFKNETRRFFSSANYNDLLSNLRGEITGVSKDFVEKTLREAMIDIFKMYTPRMDPTDSRFESMSEETTSSYIKELNSRVIFSVLTKVKVEKMAQKVSIDIKAGPKPGVMPVEVDTRIINAQRTVMDKFLDQQSERKKSSQADASAAIAGYSSNIQADFMKQFLSKN